MRQSIRYTLTTLILSSLMVGFWTVGSPINAHAQDAMPINYQGVLTDSAGNKLTGLFSITFKMYDIVDCQTMVWSETHPAVSVSNGLLSVKLGTVTPISVDILSTATPTLADLPCLVVQVESDPPMLPMVQMGATPYSVVSQRITGDITTGPGTILLGGAGNDGHLTVLDAAGDTTTSLNTVDVAFRGPVTIGGKGTDGGMIILDAAGDTLVGYIWDDPWAMNATIAGRLTIGGNGADGGLVLLDTIGDTTIALSGNGSLRVGGSGAAGGLVLLDPLGDTTIALSGNGSLRLGDGSGGVSFVYPFTDGLTGGLVMYGTLGDTTVRLVSDGSLALGGNGSDGGLVLLDAAGDTLVRKDPGGSVQRGPVTIGGNGSNGGLVLLDPYGDTLVNVGGVTDWMSIAGPLGVGVATPLAQLHVLSDDSTATDFGGVSGFDEVTAVYQAPNSGHSAISIDAVTGRDPIVYLSENGTAVWGIRSDASNAQSFQIRLHPAGGAKLAIDTMGNVGLGTTVPGFPLEMASGAHVTAGGTWTNASDRELKENFEPVDPADLLSKIATLPISEWNYKNEDDRVRHIGPTAQDFMEAFGLGGNNESISTVDPDGVALLAIQELYRRNLELSKEHSVMSERLSDLTKQLKEMRRALHLGSN